ncbi:hypothetical protein [Streptomyces sp. A30]|uniref:hypothetical protein n=1 Tax=Streptomyces sp. A30 TaxID=2789273 RepID=UPI00397FFC04
MNRRQQRAARNAAGPQTLNATIPVPPLYSVKARLAALDSDGYDHVTAVRQSTLYLAGLDWRTYPEEWPAPRVRFDQESQRSRIWKESGWLSPDEWLALCEEGAA